MNADQPIALLTILGALVALALDLDRFPEELPDWLGFLVLILGATLLIGQVIGRTLDEFGPPRPDDRYGRERDWTGLLTALGGIVGMVIYLVIGAVVLLA